RKCPRHVAAAETAMRRGRAPRPEARVRDAVESCARSLDSSRQRETGERGRRDGEYAGGARNADESCERERRESSAFDERADPVEHCVEGRDPEQHASDDREAVELAGRGRDAGGPWAQASDEEPRAEQQSANRLRDDEGVGQIDEPKIEHAKAIEPERTEHGG